MRAMLKPVMHILALSVLAGGTLPAAAQPLAEPEPPDVQPEPQPVEAVPAPTREELVERLADPEYAVRAAATAALLRDNTLDEPALRAMLELPTARDPERRRRLMIVAEHHLMRTIIHAWTEENTPIGARASAAVGFSYNPLLPDKNPYGEDAGLIILATMPGFPGYAYLRPGDVVLSIDGKTTRVGTIESVRRWVRSAIGAHLDGGTVRMTIQRGEDTLELAMPCTGIDALNEMYTTTGDGSTIRRAHAQRTLDDALARLTAGLPDPEEALPAPAAPDLPEAPEAPADPE
jgi:hypothetical protein